MIRVLTLSSLFPDQSRPVFGPFVEQQTCGISAHPDVELQVVAPLGIAPWPLSIVNPYRALGALPLREEWKGLTVLRPRFAHIPFTSGQFDARMMTRAVLPLLRRIRQDFAFDLIDAEFFFPDGPAAIQLGKALGVPVSIKARGADIHFWGHNPATRAQVIAAGQSADSMLAVSAALKRDMIALGMPEDRITVHYTGVDLDRFVPLDRKATKDRLGVKGPLIACVGALIARKSQDLVIEALQAIPAATLVLIGQGPDRDKLQAQAKALGVGDRVIFTGALPQPDIATWLGAADVMCLPSASEGLANAWVEALACGTPIVIADVGGASELIDRSDAGRLVARTAAEISGAIEALLANPPSQAAVRKTAERFTWARNTETLYEHFAALTGK